MGLNLIDLELEGIRKLMVDELEKDISNNRLYISSRLKEECRDLYLKLIRNAMLKGNDITFANDLMNNNCLKQKIPRRTKNWVSMVNLPSDAYHTLAEGEFNRFYIRAVCRKVNSSAGKIEVYRAKSVRDPRPQSQALIGKIIDSNKLLEDLRVNIGIDTILGLPAGPNSGISVRIKR